MLKIETRCDECDNLLIQNEQCYCARCYKLLQDKITQQESEMFRLLDKIISLDNELVGLKGKIIE